MAKTVIIPDTNALLHYRRPDQIDWQEREGFPQAIILLAPVVVREVTNQVHDFTNRRLRDRARRINTWLGGILRDGDGQSTVVMEVREPTSFFPSWLDQAVNDDRVIATALMRVADGDEVRVYSGDIGVHAKLKALNLKGIWPDDADRLTEERDPVEAELVAVKKTLSEYQSREPDLALEWGVGGVILEVSLPDPDLSDLPTPARQEREMNLPLIRGGATDKYAVAALAMRFRAPTDEQIAAYNEALAKYLESYTSYYDKALKYERLRARAVELSLRVHNRGTAPATSIRAKIALPDTIKLLPSRNPFGPPPEPPKKPKPPRSSIGLTVMDYPEMFAPRGDPTEMPMNSLFASMRPQVDRDDRAYLHREEGIIELRREKLAHLDQFLFEPAAIFVKPSLDGTEVDLDVTIMADQLARPVEQRLTLRFAPASPFSALFDDLDEA
jgi:hypothetical protein